MSLACLLLAAALLAPADPPGPDDAAACEARVRTAMARLLNHPSTLEIEFAGHRPAADRVLYDAVRVRADGAVFDGLTIDRADLRFRDLALDRAELLGATRLRMLSTSEILLDVRISEANLNRYVESKREKIQVDNPRIRLDRGRVQMTGSFGWKLGRITFNALGDLSVKDGNIYFWARKFEMNRLSVPAFIVKKALREMNPILDLSQFPFHARVNRIAIEDRQLVITSFPPEGAQE